MILKIPSSRWSHFSGTVDDNTTAALAGSIVNLHEAAPDEEICLLITSSGGSCQAGLAFYELMYHIVKPKLQTVALGKVGSMAVLLYLTGDTRFITKDSTMQLHEMNQSFNGEVPMKAPEIFVDANNLVQMQRRYATIVARHSGGKLTPKAVEHLMKLDTTVTAKEAIKLGLAHHILQRRMS